LVDALGSPEWTSDPRFATQEDRFAHQDLLDEHLAAWTRVRDRHEITAMLQASGVPAGAVQNAEDLSERDPQIAHRQIFFEMDHPVIGPARFEGNPARFTSVQPDEWRSAPLLGEDNEYVFKHIVGVSDDEYDELQEEGVI
jgi:crotonobetainyl-CoA:carnitine CoA-transferase CaiB-like acyl-CoA transferase